jgi:hypothetical protein
MARPSPCLEAVGRGGSGLKHVAHYESLSPGVFGGDSVARLHAGESPGRPVRVGPGGETVQCARTGETQSSQYDIHSMIDYSVHATRNSTTEGRRGQSRGPGASPQLATR